MMMMRGSTMRMLLRIKLTRRMRRSWWEHSVTINLLLNGQSINI